ncbi:MULTISPECIES: flagellin [unclassified Caulobacter]|uniref:flagellin n=1 Tax=unclassified Caulobacter TaxID=2648921 RepID=UPI000D38E46E|nr:MULTISPECIES: flagellin [unclassified Caulobacter]PTS90075.1 flagellin [Caulobacter sp. HMWF009]PTT04989.1 flagellin [Caulobacter sp. HMWF025]
MGINSVNTNAQALVALQGLNATGRDLATTTTRIATGREVNSAKDDGATYAIAKRQTADANALNAVKDSLARGRGAVDVALAAGEQVVDLLTKMKALALTGTEESIPRSSRQSLMDDYWTMHLQIMRTFEGADFDGINLLTGSQTVSFLASGDGAQTVDIDGLGAKFTPYTPTDPYYMRGHTLDEVEYAQYCLSDVSHTLKSMTAALAKLGTQGEALDGQTALVGKLQDQSEIGVGNLIDADLSKESAKLTALQTKQSLGVQALSIATNSANWLRSLFG